MRALLLTGSMFAALSAPALAEEAATEEAATEEEAAASNADDCASLEGEAKTECEAKAGEEDKATEDVGKSGKAMKKSNTGNMEAFDQDE